MNLYLIKIEYCRSEEVDTFVDGWPNIDKAADNFMRSYRRVLIDSPSRRFVIDRQNEIIITIQSLSIYK